MISIFKFRSSRNYISFITGWQWASFLNWLYVTMYWRMLCKVTESRAYFIASQQEKVPKSWGIKFCLNDSKQKKNEIIITTAKCGMHFLLRRQIARNHCRTTAAELWALDNECFEWRWWSAAHMETDTSHLFPNLKPVEKESIGYLK